MDPLSIAASASAIAGTCFKVTTAIYQFAEDARNVDWKVGDLLQEVQGLSRTSDAIASTWTKNSIIIAAQANSDRELWSCVKESLDDTKRTLVKLDDKLEELKPQSFMARGFLRRPVKALKLNLSMKDITTFKQQLQSHSSGMQSALLMINVCLLLGSNSSSASVNQVLGGLKAQIGRVEIALQGQYQHHPEDTPEAVEDNARIANNLRGLVRAAESIHSSASTVVGDSRSTVWGGSVMGNPLNEEDYGYIQRWIPPPAIVEEREEEQSTHSGFSGSKNESDITGSTSMTSFGNEESDQDSDDSDIERHLTKRYRELAFKSMETKDYDKAESFYSKVIDRGEQESFSPAEMRKMKIMLAYAYALQEKWEDAEGILVPIAMAKGTPEVLAYDGLYALSLRHAINHSKGEPADLELAVKYCKRAAGGHKKFSGRTSMQYHNAMALLAEIYNLNGDFTAAEGYRSFLPGGFEYQGLQNAEDPRGLMETMVLTTIHGLRGTPSLSNIASIDVRALTPTPGEHRRHSYIAGPFHDQDRHSPRPESSDWGVNSPSGSNGASSRLEIPKRPRGPINVSTGDLTDFGQFEGHQRSVSESQLGTLRRSMSDTPPPAPTAYTTTNHFSPTTTRLPAEIYHELHADPMPAPKQRVNYTLPDLTNSGTYVVPKPDAGVFAVTVRDAWQPPQDPTGRPSSVQAYLHDQIPGKDSLRSAFALNDAWKIIVAIDLVDEFASIAFAAGTRDTFKPTVLADLKDTTVVKALKIPQVACFDLGGGLSSWGKDNLEVTIYGEYKVHMDKLIASLTQTHDTEKLLRSQRPVLSDKSQVFIIGEYLAVLRKLVLTNLESIMNLDSIMAPFDTGFSSADMLQSRHVEYCVTIPEDTTESGIAALNLAAKSTGGRNTALAVVDCHRACLLDGIFSGILDLGAGEIVLDITIDNIETIVRATEVTSNKCTLQDVMIPLCGSFGLNLVFDAFATLIDDRTQKMKLPDGFKTVARVQGKCLDDFRVRIWPAFTGDSRQSWVINTGMDGLEFPEAGIEEGFMSLRGSDMLPYFESFAHGFTELVKLQFGELSAYSYANVVKYVLLRGDYEKDHWLLQLLRGLCPVNTSDMGDIVLPLPNSGPIRAKGAILAHILDNSNEEADPVKEVASLGLSRSTYLISTPLDFDPSRHHEDVRVTNIDGVDRCYDSAQVFFRSGSVIDLGEVMTLTVKRPVILGDSLIFHDDIYTFNQRIETGAVISMSSHFGQSPPPVEKIATLTTTLAPQHPENYFQKFPRRRGGWYYTVEYQIFISIRMSSAANMSGDWIAVPEFHIQSAFLGDDLVTVGELSVPIETFKPLFLANRAEEWKNYDQNATRPS